MSPRYLAALAIILAAGVGIAFAAVTMSEAVITKFAAEEAKYRLPSGVLGKIAKIESSGNVQARNASTDAAGLFQWIPRSWYDASRALYGAPKNLSERYNPFIATEVTAYALAQANAQNGALMQQAKADPSTGLYMAHFLGPAGARKFFALLIQHPNDAASRWFPREARYNSAVFNGRTIAGVYNFMAAKMQAPGITGVSNYSGTYDQPLTGRIMDPAGITALARPFTGPVPAASPALSYPSTYTSADAVTPGDPLPTQGTAPTVADSAGTPHALIIIAQPSDAHSGGFVLVSWSSVGMTDGSCTVVSNGATVARGESGTVRAPIPEFTAAGNLAFTARCTARDGGAVSDEASVSIE